MVDLSHKGAHQFWKDYLDPMIYRVVVFMESVENWTVDGHPEVEQALEKLGEELGHIGNYDLGKKEEFISLCGNIKMARTLRLLQGIDTAHPGAASKLLVYAEENSENPSDPAGLFLRRNIVFERLRLLARVFAPDRLNLIVKALEGENV